MARRVKTPQPIYFYQEGPEGPWRGIRFMIDDNAHFFAATAELPTVGVDEKEEKDAAPSEIIFTPHDNQHQWNVYDAKGQAFRFVIDSNPPQLVCYEKFTKKIGAQTINDTRKTVWQPGGESTKATPSQAEKKSLLPVLENAPFTTAELIVLLVKNQDTIEAEKAAKADKWFNFCKKNTTFPEEKEENNFPQELSDALSLLLNESVGCPTSYSTAEEAITALKKIAEKIAWDDPNQDYHSEHKLSTLIIRLANSEDNKLYLQEKFTNIISDKEHSLYTILKHKHVHDLIRCKINAIYADVLNSNEKYPEIDQEKLEQNYAYHTLFSGTTIAKKFAELSHNNNELMNWLINNNLLNPKAINRKDSQGNTMLHMAAENGCTGVINVLLDSKAKINMQNRDGDTPLSLALKAGQTDAADILIKTLKQDKLLAEFNKIYNALYDGQSGFFKSRRHHYDNIENVFAYAQKEPDSRTAKALELTAKYFGQGQPAYQNPQLFREVYAYAFSHGSWFSISNASGYQFWNFFAAPLQQRIHSIEPPDEATLDSEKNTRSLKIGRALQGR